MTFSRGERELQAECHSSERGERFYERHVRDQLTDKMRHFIVSQEMMFISTANAEGECDSSPRFGNPGFVSVLTSKTLAYPEFRGNGVFASLGNLRENPHIGMLFIDFTGSTVGLHVNGTARIYAPDMLPVSVDIPIHATAGAVEKPLIERWVVVDVEESYIHCSKHVPKLRKIEKEVDWGTDSPRAKQGDFFEE